MNKADYFLILLVFNFFLITFLGFWGGTQATIEEGTTLAPNSGFQLVTGIEGLPAWLAGLLALQAIFLIYLVVATFAFGG